jgi:hypothetical protein
MSEVVTPAFSSPESESHPGSAGTPDAELRQALEAAQAAEAHVLELMHATDIDVHEAEVLHAIKTNVDLHSTDAIVPSIEETRIEVLRPMDRDAIIIVAGDHRVCVPGAVLRAKAGRTLTTADLLELAPIILEHPEHFGAYGEYTIAPSSAE